MSTNNNNNGPLPQFVIISVIYDVSRLEKTFYIVIVMQMVFQ